MPRIWPLSSGAEKPGRPPSMPHFRNPRDLTSSSVAADAGIVASAKTAHALMTSGIARMEYPSCLNVFVTVKRRHKLCHIAKLAESAGGRKISIVDDALSGNVLRHRMMPQFLNPAADERAEELRRCDSPKL